MKDIRDTIRESFKIEKERFNDTRNVFRYSLYSLLSIAYELDIEKVISIYSEELSLHEAEQKRLRKALHRAENENRRIRNQMTKIRESCESIGVSLPAEVAEYFQNNPC